MDTGRAVTSGPYAEAGWSLAGAPSGDRRDCFHISGRDAVGPPGGGVWCYYFGRRPGAVGEGAPTDQARPVRDQARLGTGPLQGPCLVRSTSSRHPRHRRPGFPVSRQLDFKVRAPACPPPGPRFPPGPAEVPGRCLHHLRTPSTQPAKPPHPEKNPTKRC